MLVVVVCGEFYKVFVVIVETPFDAIAVAVVFLVVSLFEVTSCIVEFYLRAVTAAIVFV